MEVRLDILQNLIQQRKFLVLLKKKPPKNTSQENSDNYHFWLLLDKFLYELDLGVDKQYKYLYSNLELEKLNLKNFPYLPLLIFAGALITTATIGLPVFIS